MSRIHSLRAVQAPWAASAPSWCHTQANSSRPARSCATTWAISRKWARTAARDADSSQVGERDGGVRQPVGIDR